MMAFAQSSKFDLRLSINSENDRLDRDVDGVSASSTTGRSRAQYAVWGPHLCTNALIYIKYSNDTRHLALSSRDTTDLLLALLYLMWRAAPPTTWMDCSEHTPLLHCN